MKIERIELFHVEMPLIYPWRTAYGEDAAIHSVLCRMSSGSCDGWGESSPLAAPCYSCEWAGGVFAVARDWLAPALIGKNVDSGAALQAELGHFKGNCFAKAVLDNAWWNLHCQQSGTPLHRALGASREQVPVGADFGVMDSIDELLPQVGEAIAAGFPRVKLKFRPGWDIEMVRAVRKQHPDAVLHVDCNSGYCLDDLPIFQQLDDFGLAMFEQPLAHDDLYDHAAMQAEVRTPICLDESIVGIRQTAQAIALKSCRYVNIKPGRVGGLTNAVQIHDLCASNGLPCWVGGMLESAVGGAQCVALAMLDNFTYPADIFPSNRFYRQDLAEPALQLATAERPSVAAFEQQPEPVPERLTRCAVQTAVVV
jgi:O-succinylbenzoate synthase